MDATEQAINRIKRQAEAIALAGTAEGRAQVLRWAWDLPEDDRDPNIRFWQEDRYFRYRPAKPKAEELPDHWRADNGPWTKTRWWRAQQRAAQQQAQGVPHAG